MDRGATLLARDALATPDLRRLQLAAAAAGIGGWAFMVALAVHAYAVGGAAAVGLAALVRMVPAGLAAPLTGLAADRFSRRDVLLAVAARPRDPARRRHARRRRRRAAGAAARARHALHRRRDRAEARAGRAAPAPRARPLAPGRRQRALDRDRQRRVRRRRGRGRRARRGLRRGGGVRGERDRLRRGGGHARRGRGATRERRVSRALLEKRLHSPLEGLRVVARDRRLRLLVGVLSASTLVEGAVDVLVVVTALRLVDIGDAGVGWLNAAWGVGGLVGGAVALSLLARPAAAARAARRRAADRAAAARARRAAVRERRARSG